MGIFANIENPDEMQHMLHIILVYTVCKDKKDLHIKIQYVLKI